MMKVWLATIIALAVLPLRPAQACQHDEEADLKALKYAETVVVGQIDRYEIVRDQEARAREAFNSSRTSYVEDYALIDVSVDEVLLGTAPKRLRVTWDAGWMLEPDALLPGRYIFALTTSQRLPIDRVRGDRAEPTVLNLVCQDAFIFRTDSNEAKAVRQILRRRQH